jgi:hypothetical protein
MAEVGVPATVISKVITTHGSVCDWPSLKVIP